MKIALGMFVILLLAIDIVTGLQVSDLQKRLDDLEKDKEPKP